MLILFFEKNKQKQAINKSNRYIALSMLSSVAIPLLTLMGAQVIVPPDRLDSLYFVCYF